MDSLGVTNTFNTEKRNGEDVDRIGVTLGLNLHLSWLRGNDVMSHLKVNVVVSLWHLPNMEICKLDACAHLL